MATINFTLKIQETSEIQHKTDKFYLIELTGMEMRTDSKENIIKVQANNLFADKLMHISPGDIVNFVCEIEGRIWNKSEAERIVFQNLVVKEYTVLKSESKDNLYTGNPKKQDVSGMFDQGGSATPLNEPLDLNPDDLPF